MNLKKKSKFFKHILNFFKKITYKCKKSFLQSTTTLIGLNEFLGTFWFNNINQEITTCNYQTYVFNLPEPATAQMVGMLTFNKSLILLMVIIVLLIAWLLFFAMLSFQDFNTSLKPIMFHSNVLEIAWTSLPALALLKVAAPSISILYSLDEDISSSLRLKVLGNQWFWSYEIDISSLQTKFKNEGGIEIIKFSSYILSQEKIEKQKCLGLFRLLETNKRIVLPVKKSVTFLITSLDVLHSWSLPNCGIKVDACPGRLNQANTTFQRIGVFFGQCSEICGVNHGFMPIVLMSVKNDIFLTHLEMSLIGNPTPENIKKPFCRCFFCKIAKNHFWFVELLDAFLYLILFFIITFYVMWVLQEFDRIEIDPFNDLRIALREWLKTRDFVPKDYFIRFPLIENEPDLSYKEIIVIYFIRLKNIVFWWWTPKLKLKFFKYF